jgi:phage shock protein A
MKYLLLIVFSITLFSCDNKKAEIVDQIKVYKDSLAEVGRQQLELTKNVSNIQEKYSGQQALDSVYALETKQAPTKAGLSVKRMIFQGKIDSLELELKKY